MAEKLKFKDLGIWLKIGIIGGLTNFAGAALFLIAILLGLLGLIIY